MRTTAIPWIVEDGRLKLANLVTLSRGVLIIPILALLALGYPAWALTLYLAACATDLVDGWLARQMGQASTFGAQLDAAVDNVFSLAILPFLVLAIPGVLQQHLAALVVLFGAPLAYLPMSRWLSGRIMMFHVWSAKAGAFLLFALWPLIVVTGQTWWIGLAAAVVGLSRAEQILFILRGGTDLDAPHGFVAIPNPSKATAS